MAETFARRKNWAVAAGAAFLCLGHTAAAQGEPGDLYGKWWSLCDNGRTCRALGTGGTGGAALTVIVSRQPGAFDPVQISLVTDPPRTPQTLAPWRVLIDDKPIASASPVLRDGSLRAELSPRQAATVAAGLIEGGVLRLEGPGADTSLSLDGAATALRQMDEVQGRAGGVTALASKGQKAAVAVPPPPPLPVVVVDRVSKQMATPRPMPARAGKQLRRCERAFGEPDSKPRGEAYGLGKGELLWLAPCGAGEEGVLVLISDYEGKRTRPALPSGVQASARFDSRLGALVTLEPKQGLSDCGRLIDWAWTGEVFVKIREREMRECVGLPVDLWPDVYRAVVRRGA